MMGEVDGREALARLGWNRQPPGPEGFARFKHQVPVQHRVVVFEDHKTGHVPDRSSLDCVTQSATRRSAQRMPPAPSLPRKPRCPPCETTRTSTCAGTLSDSNGSTAMNGSSRAVRISVGTAMLAISGPDEAQR